MSGYGILESMGVLCAECLRPTSRGGVLLYPRKLRNLHGFPELGNGSFMMLNFKEKRFVGPGLEPLASLHRYKQNKGGFQHLWLPDSN